MKYSSNAEKTGNKKKVAVLWGHKVYCCGWEEIILNVHYLKLNLLPCTGAWLVFVPYVFEVLFIQNVVVGHENTALQPIFLFVYINIPHLNLALQLLSFQFVTPNKELLSIVYHLFWSLPLSQTQCAPDL